MGNSEGAGGLTDAGPPPKGIVIIITNVGEMLCPSKTQALAGKWKGITKENRIEKYV